MEALGIAANVIAVVDLAAKAGTLVFRYCESAKNYPANMSKLHQELSDIQKSVSALHKVAKKLDDHSRSAGKQSPATSALATALKNCRDTLEKSSRA